MLWALVLVSEGVRRLLRETRRRGIMPLLLEMFGVVWKERKVENRLYDFYDGFVLDMDRCWGLVPCGRLRACWT